MAKKYIDLTGLSYAFTKIKTLVDSRVPTTRKINGKTLNADVTLTASDVGAAESSHNHAASAITSGTLGVARGGTGVTSNPSMLVNLASTTADTVFETSPRPGVTGTLPVSNGGTGSTTAADARTALGITPANIGAATSGHSHDAATTSAGGFMSPEDKSKLDGIAAGANAYTHPSYTARTGVPTANQTPAFGGTFTVSQPVSDATGHITAVNSRTITIPNAAATTSAAGLMSAADKTKLDGIATGANKTTVDTALSSTSTNPVQNNVINTALAGKADSSHTHTGLATVTTSGTGEAYTATVSGITALTKGANFIMIPHTTSTSTTPTLNVNGLGAKTIQRMTSSNDYSAPGYNEGWLQSTRPVLVIYSGSYWYVQAMERPAAYDLRGTVPIASGGTGATTAEGALENLGITDLIAQATAAGLKVETGTYTGTTGTTNTQTAPSKSINFEGVPVFIYVCVDNSSASATDSGYAGFLVGTPGGATISLTGGSSTVEFVYLGDVKVTVSGTTLTIASMVKGSNGYAVMNYKNVIYRYFAITM